MNQQMKAMRYLLKVNPKKYSVERKRSPRGLPHGTYFVMYMWDYFFPIGFYKHDFAYIKLSEPNGIPNISGPKAYLESEL